MFFEGLSDEMVLRIFSFASREDQARLTRVCSRFNFIANDTSLELSNYKPQHKPEICAVGNVRLMVREVEKTRKWLGAYELFIVKNDKEVDNSALRIDQKSFKELVQVKNNGVLSVVEKLKGWGSTASDNAMILKEEFAKVNQTPPVNNPAFNK